MLVLSRKVGEEVLIGDSIRVRILEIRGNRVKLGFTAPDDIRFMRLEVVQL
ncbi:MAG TPA: carbon storage regulator, partial [Pirellulales bacterium]|nr:carbon storage regulator [Pirellulales bacterium]